MTKPTISTFGEIAPLLIQKYERYLPTAFDDSMTMLQKVNMVINKLDELGVVTNSLIVQWNEIVEWVLGEGLNDAVIAKMDQMVIDGVFDTIINETIFNELNIKVDGKETKRELNVKDYGAIGDGVTDDTTAITTAITNAVDGESVRFPTGIYRTTSVILVNKNINLLMDGVMLVDHAGVGIELKDLGRTTDINSHHVINVKNKIVNHTQITSIGVKLNGCYNQKIDINLSRDFYYGILLDSDLGKGCVYNEISLKALYNNKIHVFLSGLQNGSLDSQKSWVNQNTFIGGRLSWSGDVGSRDGYYGIQVGKDANGYLPNGNVFLNTSIEDVGNAGNYAVPVRCYGHDNMFIGTRTEGGLTIQFETTSYNNKWLGGFYTTLKNVVDTGLGNEYDFSRGGIRKWSLNTNDVNEFIASGSGVHALKLYNKTSSNNPILGLYESDGTTLAVFMSATGEMQWRKNVKHIYGLYNSPPATGTWQRNDVVWKNNPSAGQYIGWVCVTGGVDTAAVWKGFGMIEA